MVRQRFCSAACHASSRCFREQIPTTPLAKRTSVERQALRIRLLNHHEAASPAM
jgi:hypothetical protein